MEKVCEFCKALRPLVYCNADAAYLCLSCDAKVHWANELSGRHLRTLVCNSCRCHLAYVQCLDHKMLICRDCDQNLHGSSSPHCKRAVNSFMGCPSAIEFATLWGFEFKEIEKSVNHKDQFASSSCVFTDVNEVRISGKRHIQTSIPSTKFDKESSSQLGQVCKFENLSTSWLIIIVWQHFIDFVLLGMDARKEIWVLKLKVLLVSCRIGDS